MSTFGYFRYPALHGETVVFVSEDDLWTVAASGGVARRLTANLGTITSPSISPDGRTIAFTGREEGNNEVYVVPIEGGPVRRVTYLGTSSSVVGWTPDGAKILFGSDFEQPFDRQQEIYAVSPEGGLPEPFRVGPALSISVRAGNQIVLGRNNNDPARWKRYRGGTAGDLWIDAAGSGEFRRLLTLKGNLARPMWVGDRVFFLSDHDGIANLYSCTPDGQDLRQHTHRTDYFARFPATDGSRIVYHAGGDLYVYDPAFDTDTKIEVIYHSPQVGRQRKFVEAARFMDGYDLSPQGQALALTTRGKSFTLGNWEGAVHQQGGDSASNPVRYRLTSWLNDGKRVVTVTDSEGVETLEIHSTTEKTAPKRLEGLDIGRPMSLLVSPTADQLLLANHRNQLLFIDLVEGTLQQIDRSDFSRIQGANWSPDGRWVAYGFSQTQYTSAIKLWDKATGTTQAITEPILVDSDPAFDPEGKYLYFLGQRELNPVYDGLHFDLGFPKGTRPYLITLKADTLSPFIPQPRPLQEGPKPKLDSEEVTPEEEATGEAPAKPLDALPNAVEIDLEGIQNRVLAFPVPEGRYGQIAGIKGKVLFTSYPVEPAIGQGGGEPGPKGVLEVYDLKELKHEPLIQKVSEFTLSRDGKTLAYRSARKLRVVIAGVKPDEKAGPEAGRKSGWIDIGRIKVSLDPGVEWRQMAHEAWRLQRDYFWTADMSQIDWTAIWARYAPLVERVGTRGEFSDLMWEMQGELGTSHAYEMGGDYRSEPSYPTGFLGASLTFDSVTGVYKIGHIVQGAPGEARASSPLLAPGIQVKEGDVLLAINGRTLSQSVQPQEMLVNLAGSEVVLSVQASDGKTRDVTVTTLKSEFPARYREWVETNRRYVHEKTGGKVGYVHVPDMGANGYAEFHRLYLAEADRDGLIVDVRYNRGGHVSQLLIEKLARRRVGYDIPRWGQPQPYPDHSIAGPIVALTNQFAGSDGDIFSHVFKLKQMGTLIGKRTWGGVIGIWPRNPLADGAMTSQPEFSFWFQDVGWGVENYGTDPDIDIDIAPQDYAKNFDPQMEKALEVILGQLAEKPVVRPDFTTRPNLAYPPKMQG
jgi:tricorn protease